MLKLNDEDIDDKIDADLLTQTVDKVKSIKTYNLNAYYRGDIIRPDIYLRKFSQPKNSKKILRFFDCKLVLQNYLFMHIF